MKKIGLFILIVLLVIPFSVMAAIKQSVKTLDANASGSTINYSGTMEDGSYAVMCKLYNSSDEELDLLSSSVDNNKFSGRFENLSDGTYNILCANYEGGEIKTVSVVIKNEKVFMLVTGTWYFNISIMRLWQKRNRSFYLQS